MCQAERHGSGSTEQPLILERHGSGSTERPLILDLQLEAEMSVSAHQAPPTFSSFQSEPQAHGASDIRKSLTSMVKPQWKSFGLSSNGSNSSQTDSQS